MKLLKKISILLLLSIISCSKNSPDDVTDPDTVDTKITYNTNVKPIIDNNCLSCHGNPTTNNAPISLTNYNEVLLAAKQSDLLKRMTDPSTAMPPAGLLPSTTSDIVKKWINDGYPEK